MHQFPRIHMRAHEYRIGEVRATLATTSELVGIARDAFDPCASAQAMESLASELERAAKALRDQARAQREERAQAKAEFDAMRLAHNETPEP